MPFFPPHTPILERFNAMGHIESLLLDGQRHYFGHDPLTDRIVSPLIPDPSEMAEFAAQWMRGHAGPRDAASWLTDIHAATTRSRRWPTPLVVEERDRMAVEMALRMAAQHDIPSPFDVQDNVVDLLHAVYGDIADGRLQAMFDWAVALDQAGEDDEPLGWAFDVIHGVRPAPVTLSHRDVADALRHCMGSLADAAVGNWISVFGAIIRSCDAIAATPFPTPAQVSQTLAADRPFEVVGYADVANKVPETSLFHRADDVSLRPDRQIVLLIDGDLHLDRLDLDDPLARWRQPDADVVLPWFILVTGNVVIEQHLWSLETDGACGLVVLGHLTARNAIVGGQQIHVGGNLTIEELYWGDYNHGCLYVEGDTTAALLIQTDYHMDLVGKVSCLKRVDDLDELDGDELMKIIATDCVMQAEPEPAPEWSLNATAMLERLEAGHSVICRDALEHPDPPFTIPSLFADANVSPENFLRLSDPDLLPEGSCLHSFQRDGLDMTVMAYLSEEHRIPRRAILIKDIARNIGVSFTQEPATAPWSWRDVVSLRRPQRGWVLLKATCDNLDTPDPDWVGVEGVTFTPEYTALILKGWAAFLEWASYRHWAACQIPADRVRGLLALPVAAPYDDYTDSDRNGLWVGSFHAAFRQQRIGADGEVHHPILRFSRSRYCRDTDEATMESFYYDLERCQDGQERVRVRHLVDQESAQPSMPLDAEGGPRLVEAVRLFHRAAGQLEQVNAALLEGTPPFHATDDAFAMRHWRDRGYLPR